MSMNSSNFHDQLNETFEIIRNKYLFKLLLFDSIWRGVEIRMPFVVCTRCEMFPLYSFGFCAIDFPESISLTILESNTIELAYQFFFQRQRRQQCIFTFKVGTFQKSELWIVLSVQTYSLPPKRKHFNLRILRVEMFGT